MKKIENDLVSFVEKGGPEPGEYEELNRYFKIVNTLRKEGGITRGQIRQIWDACGDAFTEDTMQGFVCRAPHGYRGDFEIIERIYTKWISPKKHLEKWDRFFHWQAATHAVRNRKDYFKNILFQMDQQQSLEPSILNVGSGPCRDVYEYKCENPSSKIRISCLDMDSKAIEYSRNLLNGFDVTFFCENAFRFSLEKKFDLVWSAGLFDYLDTDRFLFLLDALIKMTGKDGKVVIGNFSKTNPSRDYMEFGEWMLFHRDASELTELALKAGVPSKSVFVESEPTSVNLFMTIDKKLA